MNNAASHTSVTFSALGLLSSIALSSGRMVLKNITPIVLQEFYYEIKWLIDMENGNFNCRRWEKIFVVDQTGE